MLTQVSSGTFDFALERLNGHAIVTGKVTFRISLLQSMVRSPQPSNPQLERYSPPPINSINQPEQYRPLPAGWEEYKDLHIGRTYFFDDNTRTTTWADPRHMSPYVPMGGTYRRRPLNSATLSIKK